MNRPQLLALMAASVWGHVRTEKTTKTVIEASLDVAEQLLEEVSKRVMGDNNRNPASEWIGVDQ